MIVTEAICEGEIFPAVPVAQKIRTESDSSIDSNSGVTDASHTVRNLELEGVKELFQDYDLLETAEAVSCVICGKSYKSKVCVKKHLWEHSVYWDLFDGLKKQQRVLSIQAAIILAIKFNPSLSLLLVTQSSNNIKKKSSEKSSDKNVSGDKNNNSNNMNNVNQRKRKIDHVLSDSSDSYLPRKSPYHIMTSPPTTNLNLLTEQL